jgi:hypothetical protein
MPREPYAVRETSMKTTPKYVQRLAAFSRGVNEQVADPITPERRRLAQRLQKMALAPQTA